MVSRVCWWPRCIAEVKAVCRCFVLFALAVVLWVPGVKVEVGGRMQVIETKEGRNKKYGRGEE